MYTIAIIAQKGGTGKTTLALNLAVAAEEQKQTALIIDLDPQASAKGWHDHRQADEPVVISAQAARLGEVLEAAREHGAAFVVIDTAPHSESAALAAARAADLVLVPCRPGVLDLRGIAASRDISELAKADGVAVLNAVPPRGTLGDEAAEAIAAYGLTVAPVRVAQRVSFVHSLTASQAVSEYEPSGKAASEIKDLFEWAWRRVGCSTRRHVDMKTRAGG